MNKIYIKIYLSFIPLFLFSAGSIFAEIYKPQGRDIVQDSQDLWGIDFGIRDYDDDYYLYVRPSFSLGFMNFRIGLQVPLEFLALDRDPKTGDKVGTVREGLYNTKEDYIKLIRFVSYGKHLDYDPKKAFTWSVFYGHMTDGYIGHKTIVNRYITSLDSEVFRAGVMGDINNRWGGVEVFKSDLARQEVSAGRVFIRPIGIVKSLHNVLFANSSFDRNRSVALSVFENRDPEMNGGIFFQESSSSGGSLKQHLHNKVKDDVKEDLNNVDRPELNNSGSGRTGPAGGNKRNVEYKTVTDPVTGEKKTIVVDGDPVNSQRESAEKGGKAGEKWTPGYFNRWALGYTIARDYKAPLSLEKDGSGNLVVDPYINLPREGYTETLTIVGFDTEFRMSPFKFLELTPYADLNRIQNVNDSEGLHVGIDAGFTVGPLLKVVFRPEYREFTENYIPRYFDSFYSYERTTYNPGGTGNGSGTAASTSQTKFEYLRSLGQSPEKYRGGEGTLIVDFVQFAVIEVSYQDLDGPNNSEIFAGLYIPPVFGMLFLNGYYMKKNYDKFSESFQYDDRSLLSAEAGLIIFAGFTLKGTLTRSWIYDKNTSTYVANDEKTVSFGYTSTL